MGERKKQTKAHDVFRELLGWTPSEHAVPSTLEDQQGKSLYGKMFPCLQEKTSRNISFLLVYLGESCNIKKKKEKKIASTEYSPSPAKNPSPSPFFQEAFAPQKVKLLGTARTITNIKMITESY